MTTRNAAEATARGGAQPGMAPAGAGRGLRRAAGGLFVVGAVGFAAAAMVLSSTFNWPDVLREPASVVLPAFAGGGTSLVWTWFATGWAYAILAVPILLLPAVLGRRDDPALRVATYAGATSVVLSLTGFLRWVFVVPPLARSYVTGDVATRAAADAAWTAQHQYGGALLGEHLRQVLVIGWSVTVCVIIVRTRSCPAGSASPASPSARSTCSTKATSWPPPSPGTRSPDRLGPWDERVAAGAAPTGSAPSRQGNVMCWHWWPKAGPTPRFRGFLWSPSGARKARREHLQHARPGSVTAGC